MYLLFYIFAMMIIRFTLFFFNDTATTEIYTLSLHDALPISSHRLLAMRRAEKEGFLKISVAPEAEPVVERLSRTFVRSEEHTSELQSRPHLVCRLLLEKKKKIKI